MFRGKRSLLSWFLQCILRVCMVFQNVILHMHTGLISDIIPKRSIITHSTLMMMDDMHLASRNLSLIPGLSKKGPRSSSGDHPCWRFLPSFHSSLPFPHQALDLPPTFAASQGSRDRRRRRRRRRMKSLLSLASLPHSRPWFKIKSVCYTGFVTIPPLPRRPSRDYKLACPSVGRAVLTAGKKKE